MKWNAFNLVEPAIDRTGKLLFPFKFKNWLKLGFISMLSGGKTFSGMRGYNFSGFGKGSSKITGNAVSKLGRTGGAGLGILGFAFGVIYLIWTFITSIFSFIFIDALVIKGHKIKKSWKDNEKRGTSFFGFRVLMGLLSLAILGVIFLPVIVDAFRMGIPEYLRQFDERMLSSLLPYLFLAVLWGIVFGIFMSFVNSFSLIDMYKNNKGITDAIKNTFKNINKQKAESLVFLIAIFVLGMVVGIISIIALIPIVAILGLPLIAIMIGISTLSNAIATFLIVVLVIPYAVFMAYTFNVIILPLSVFSRYFSILGYEKLYGQKVIK